MIITKINTIANIKLYILLGGVPNGSQEINTIADANQSNKEKLEVKERRNLIHNGISLYLNNNY